MKCKVLNCSCNRNCIYLKNHIMLQVNTGKCGKCSVITVTMQLQKPQKPYYVADKYGQMWQIRCNYNYDVVAYLKKQLRCSCRNLKNCYIMGAIVFVNRNLKPWRALICNYMHILSLQRLIYTCLQISHIMLRLMLHQRETHFLWAY